MIFVARYSDGSCGIAQAENEEAARELLQSEEIWFDPETNRIVSLRPLSSSFVSRWFFDDHNSRELNEIDRLSGMLGERVADEVFEHEYPMIAVAHATTDREEPFFDPKADQMTPLAHNPAQLRQMNRWSENLRRRLRQAVELELQRFK